MSRRKGTLNTPQEIVDEIIEKHGQGMTRQELANVYGKPFKTIKAMIWRENRKKDRIDHGLPSKKPRGRKPAVTLQEYKYENQRLKMENKLLRDFLRLAGRR